MTYFIQENSLINIGNAIRNKTGSTIKMTPAEMVEAINNIEMGGNSSAPETCSVTISTKTFTGHIVYQTSDGWQVKYGSTFGTYTIIKNSAIFIIVDKSLYSLSGVSTSGNATTESAILSDSDYTCTYVIVTGDTTLTIRGTW